jgi:hypothetical protein
MTEKQRLTAKDADWLRFHPEWRNRRWLRLFACACCRMMLPVLPIEPAFESAIAAAEDYAEEDKNQAAAVGKRTAVRAAMKPHFQIDTHDRILEINANHRLHIAQNFLFDLSDGALEDFPLRLGEFETFFQGQPAGKRLTRAGVRSFQAHFLRDIYENPFREVVFDPKWRTATVIGVAQKMYDRRVFDAMPILADALQDAGCESDDILDHCRDEKLPHVRGCWVIDRVLKLR